MANILNQAQAEAIASAMAHLTNVGAKVGQISMGGGIGLVFYDDDAIGVSLKNQTVAEYDSLADFIAAHGL